jgi:tetratricopeptide (TPR) repeat protein
METTETEIIVEAEQYHLKALFILHELQANKKVYGSNSAISGAAPANVDLALQYINRSLEFTPENAIYLNLKALLLWEGLGQKEQAAALLEKAAQLNPSDIDIQNNLKAIKTSQCVVATAAFGSPLASEVHLLRWWRDEVLKASKIGALAVAVYYSVSPPIAKFIAKHSFAMAVTRFFLYPIIRQVQKYKTKN